MAPAITNIQAVPAPPGKAREGANRRRHIPQLDGIRGLAIILVMLCHSHAILKDIPYSGYLGYGWIGVDLFFVLSGFLITRILLSSRSSPEYYRGFYIRRGLRIWPLYYLFIVASVGLVHFLNHNATYQQFAQTSEYLRNSPFQIITPLPYYFLFLQNLYPLSLFSSRDFMAITWSLCIEEHFYLIWPVLVRNFTVRKLKVALVTFLAIEPLLRVLLCLGLRHYPPTVLYEAITRISPFHFDSIAAGSLLALVWNNLVNPAGYFKRFALLALAGFAATAILVTFQETNGYLFSFCFSSVALMCTGLVGLGLLGWQEHFFTLPALRYVGRISYGLYLIHPTVFAVMQSRSIYRKLGLGSHLYTTEVLATLAAFAISLLVATLSWRLYESPFLRLKERLT